LHEDRAPSRDQTSEPLGCRRVDGIALARDRERRARNLAQAIPDRLERTLPAGSQELGQLARVVTQPVTALSFPKRGRLSGEDRQALPARHDLGDRMRLDPAGELFIGGPPLASRRLVLDARAGAHEDERQVPLRRAQRGVQREASAQRVADKHRAGLGRTLDLAEPSLEGGRPRIEAGAPVACRKALGHSTPDVRALHEARYEGHLASAGTVHGEMIPINRTFAPLQVFVDELARCGLENAVTSPGSRDAPILLTLAAERRVRSLSMLDERSAGFAALGMAKATGRPVAIACTSGTAAANLLPAIVEAHEARVPLIVITADRPPELRDTGAGQAIDQIKLYGSAVKWFVEVGNHEPGRGAAVHHRALACRAFHTAASGRPGPVHLNFALREPLAPVGEELEPRDWEGRADGRPWVEQWEPPRVPGATLVDLLARELAGCARGALVCGPTSEDIAEPAGRLAVAAGWPLLAEPTSGTRCGTHDRSHVIAHYDALLRDERFAADHRPEVIVRIGDTPTSKPLRTWLAGARQVLIDPHSTWHEPTRAAETIVAASAAATCDEVALALERDGGARDPEWLASWRRADAVVPEVLAAAPDPFEPKVYTALAGSIGDRAIVWLSSSMPVRDVEAFFPQVPERVRFLANRGANGIDGVVSSALGAACTTGSRCYLLTGELALVHDLSGVAALRRHGVNLTIVCANNGGGGIFDFLPVAEHADREHYEQHIATPSNVELEHVATLAGMRHVVARTPDEVRAALVEPALIEIRTDRARNVELHREVHERIAHATSANR